MQASGTPIGRDRRANTRLLRTGATLAMALALASCPSLRPELRTVRYDSPGRPIPIATRGRAHTHQLIGFFARTNPVFDRRLLATIARTYIAEAIAEGVNSDIAFCQMVHETNYLRFGGSVDPSQNNFCGLGATGGGEPGLSFPSVEIGIRAHIQHLKAYANDRPLRNPLVDPRFRYVRRGRAPYVRDLAGTWAADPDYGEKLRRKLRSLERHLGTSLASSPRPEAGPSASQMPAGETPCQTPAAPQPS